MPTKRKYSHSRHPMQKTMSIYPHKKVFMDSFFQEHQTVNGIPTKDVDIEHKYNNGIETIQGHYNNDPIYMIRTHAPQNEKKSHKITNKKHKKHNKDKKHKKRITR